MKYIRIFINLLALALFLALAPAALASNTWYVDGVNGNDNNNCESPQTACKTIGHAISLCSSGDTIKVAPATYTENLTIGISLKILGANAATTIVDGGQNGSVFTISCTATNVVLSKLTIQDGNSDSGGGVINCTPLTISNSTISGNSATGVGGGVAGFAPLTIKDSTVSGNSADEGGGIVSVGTLTVSNSTISRNSAADYGGGIYNDDVLTLNNSTISGNSAAFAGGVLNPGTLTLNNSTISGNSAAGYAGGILNYGGGTLALNNSTISGNSGSYWAGGIYFDSSYGGSVTFQNSIVANSSGGNCYGTMTSNGYNLSDDNTCNFAGPGDMNDTKAKLAALGNYGGPTQTIKEFLHSPTVDAGNPSGCTDGNGNPLTTDQRGDPRPGKYKTHKICDMGAYERQTD